MPSGWMGLYHAACDDYLGKAAGSRGGKVIGTTRSGKAIYASSSKQHYGDNFRAAHKTFSRADHKDAEDEHHSQAGKAAQSGRDAAYEHEGLTGEQGYSSRHHKTADNHLEAAEQHRKAAFHMKD